MRVYRLEFLQPDGRWTGPYCAEWMTPRAFAIRDVMLPRHKADEYHLFPDAQLFTNNPGKDRYVCGSMSMKLLEVWFDGYLEAFRSEGGHIGVYDVPDEVIAHNDGHQVVYQQRRAKLITRQGRSINRERLIERIHLSKQ